nr:hypothetical protein [Tanacetum cinerariifolium]
MMSYLTPVVTSHYLTTNNQLRNSLNPKQQATINNERVTLQPIQGRQTSLAIGTSRTYTQGASGNNYRKQRTVLCYNCKRKATCPNNTLIQRGNEMIHNPRITEAQAIQTVITHNAAYQDDVLDTYDSNCDELQVAKIALMANLSHYGLDALAETEITNDSNIIPYSQYVIESQQAAVENSNFPALILYVIEQLKTQVANYTKINMYNKSVNDTLTTKLERYKEQVRILKEGQNVDLEIKDNILDLCAQSNEESRNIDREIALEQRIKHLDDIVFKRVPKKDMVIKKLKERIKSLSGNMKEDKIKKELEEIETINIELDHRVTKLIAENEHLKQTYKLITTAEVPLRKPIALPKPVVTLIYSGKPKASKNNVPVIKSKHIKSLSANKKEPNKFWGSTVSNVPSSSINEWRLSKLFSGIWIPAAPRLGHNLFSVGQFCDSDLEVAFRQHTCFIRNLEEAVATVCYTQNHSIVRLHHGKTPYELLHDKRPDLSFFHVFGALCYPTNDSENLGKLQPKVDIDDYHDLDVAYMNDNPFFSILILEVSFDQSSSTDSIHTVMHPDHQISKHNSKWTKDHLLENIIGELARPVSIRLQLHEQAPFYYYDAFLTSVEPKTYKDALTQSCWIEAMQEELNVFDRLEVWELVSRPDKVMVITLKWIYKVARLEAIRIFLAFAAYMNIVVYQMDVKTAFLKVDTPMMEKSKLDEDKERKAIDPSHYRDVDHAGCQDTCHSTSGSLQFLGDRLVSWSSKRSKHIEIRYHFIKEHVENGVIKLYFVNTEYQLANIFTKSLGRERIEFLINKLGMRSFTPETLKQLAYEVEE